MRRFIVVAFTGALIACGDGSDVPTSPVDAAAPTSTPAARVAVACGGKVIYVSPAGNDDADGCSVTMPLRTIARAFSDIASTHVTDHEVHVCAGDYVEDLELSVHATIRGGYACDTFQRAATFGAVSVDNEKPVYDALNGTLIHAATSTTTLRVSGAAVDDAVQIEGLHIVGPTTSDITKIDSAGWSASTAMLLSGGASPHIERCVIECGAITVAATTRIGTAGLVIGGQSHTTVEHTLVLGRSLDPGPPQINASVT